MLGGSWCSVDTSNSASYLQDVMGRKRQMDKWCEV